MLKVFPYLKLPYNQLRMIKQYFLTYIIYSLCNRVLLPFTFILLLAFKKIFGNEK